MIEQWKLLATTLGFEFKEGFDALLESPELIKLLKDQNVSPEDLEKAKSMLHNPLVEGMIKKAFFGIVCGKHDCYNFYLTRSPQSSSSQKREDYVYVIMIFEKSLNCEINIRKKTIADTLVQIFSKRKYLTLESGGENLKNIVATAKDKSQAELLLMKSGVMKGIKDLFANNEEIEVQDCGLRYEAYGNIIEPAEALRIMSHLAKFARILV